MGNNSAIPQYSAVVGHVGADRSVFATQGFGRDRLLDSGRATEVWDCAYRCLEQEVSRTSRADPVEGRADMTRS
jgi:hypothetical protein